MSMHDQIVRFSATSSAPEDNTTNSILAEKEATLVVRLEQELTQAQICVRFLAILTPFSNRFFL